MNILFDISVLGVGHAIARARTGIFRVVEHTALGLAASEECEVAFCASQGNYRQCSAYLKSTAQLAGYDLMAWGDHVNFLRGVISNLLIRIDNDYIRKHLTRARDRLVLQSIFPKSPTADETGADIYHSTLYPLPYGLDRRRVKVFQTVYDLIPILFPQYFEFGEDRLIKNVLSSLTADTFIICISESTKNDLCNHVQRLKPERIFVAPLAASENFYQCTDKDALDHVRKKYAIPADARYFLSVSTLEPRKNIGQTIRCFADLVRQQELHDVYLVLTGAIGWDYEKIFKEIAHAQEIKDKIVVTGYVPDEELAPLYSGALAFVYPSLYEGFGLPPLEAMQCGTPVITSNTSSLPEVVGDAGIMVDPHDSDGLCQAMFDLYANRRLRQEISLRSLDRAKLFSWEKYMNDLIKAYRTALS